MEEYGEYFEDIGYFFYGFYYFQESLLPLKSIDFEFRTGFKSNFFLHTISIHPSVIWQAKCSVINEDINTAVF